VKTAAALGALALLTALADTGSAKRQEARMHEIAEQTVDDHSSDNEDRLGNIESRLAGCGNRLVRGRPEDFVNLPLVV